MALPDPHPGLVICYAYLWRADAVRGVEQGLKDRPCAVALAMRKAEDQTVVVVVPITHSPPRDPALAVELPAALKAHLGLDAARSWIVLSETNKFLWPGPDLRPVSRDQPDRFAFGPLPPKFFARVRDRLLEIAAARGLKNSPRTG